jgi:hypothetical protein
MGGEPNGRSTSPLRLAPGLGALLLLVSACGTPRPVSHFTLAVRSPDVVRSKVIRRDVEGEWCFTQNLISAILRPPWRARLADRGRAVEDALEQVPGANVLTHVDLSVRVEQYLLFQRVCSLVIGDAGTLQ